MASIKPLPSLVVNQIAAGEVVERPASVVKELLENAVDSGATRIDLIVEDGGMALVRVVDNGCGIAADELPLAVTNHATSKIASADDLFRVVTLGFRGEALASIASVSRLVIRSRREGADGAEIAVSGGVGGEVHPAGCPVGTTVEVRDLFFNTPVRRKFLRTAPTEMGHVSEALARVALAHPAVHFTLTSGGRVLHDLPPCAEPSNHGPPEAGEDRGWRDRIAALFGEDLAAALIAVESRDERPEGLVRLSGFVADPKESRTHTRMQHLLVNGRAIRDKSLQHALGEAYRGLLLTGRKPVCFLRLEMPPALVDVNVHPQKLEVRFTDSGPLYSQLLGTLRSRFLSSDLRVSASALAKDLDDDPLGDATGGLVDWAKGELGQRQRRFDEGGAPAFRPFPDAGGALSMHRFEGARAAAVSRAAVGDDAAHISLDHDAALDDSYAGRGGDRAEAYRFDAAVPTRALQLHNRYLIVETPAGMEVIDQHALHERVLYEQLRARALAGPLETQRLLVPEPVDLAPAEAAAVLAARDVLASVGFEVRPFGGDTVLVHTAPAMLRRCAPAETLRDLAAQLAAEEGATPTPRDVVDSLLHTMSCKAAVKYGDPLTDEEIAALLAARPETENHHHCPHGRPTSLVFTREELDRRFQRI